MPSVRGFTTISPVAIRRLYEPFEVPNRYTVSGVTKDSTGAALGGCTVEIYEGTGGPGEPHGMLRGSTVSDANGNYSLNVTETSSGLTFRAIAYKAGAPDVGGRTVNAVDVVVG